MATFDVQVNLNTNTATIEVEKLAAALGDIETNSAKASDSLASMAEIGQLAFVGLGAAATELATRGLKSIVDISQQSIAQFTGYQQNMKVIEQLIKTTGGTANITAKEIDKFAISLSEATLAGRGEVLEASKVLLSFRKISGDTFTRTLSVAQDLTEVMGQGLKSSVLQLAKALEDPVRGVSALTESGTVFTEKQREMIRTLVESGNIMEAQNFILNELEAQYGAAAEAAGTGLAGAFDTLGERTARLRGALGKALSPAVGEAINKFSELALTVLENDDILDSLTGTAENLAKVFASIDFGFVAEGLQQIAQATEWLTGKMQPLLDTLNKINTLRRRVEFEAGNLSRNEFTGQTNVASVAQRGVPSTANLGGLSFRRLRGAPQRLDPDEIEALTTTPTSSSGGNRGRSQRQPKPFVFGQTTLTESVRAFGVGTFTPNNAFGDIRRWGDPHSFHRSGAGADFGDRMQGMSVRAAHQGFTAWTNMAIQSGMANFVEEIIWNGHGSPLGDWFATRGKGPFFKLDNGKRVPIDPGTAKAHNNHLHVGETTRGGSSFREFADLGITSGIELSNRNIKETEADFKRMMSEQERIQQGITGEFGDTIFSDFFGTLIQSAPEQFNVFGGQQASSRFSPFGQRPGFTPDENLAVFADSFSRSILPSFEPGFRLPQADVNVDPFGNVDMSVMQMFNEQLQEQVATLELVEEFLPQVSDRYDQTRNSLMELNTESENFTINSEALAETFDQQAEALKVYEELANTATNAFTEFSIGVISGTKSIGESLAQLATQILSFLANKAFQSLFGQLFGGLIPSIGGTGVSATGGGFLGNFATGFKFFAEGGVAQGPTAAIVGERQPEAIVPLPDGRSIPVMLGGDMSGSMTNNIVVNVTNEGASEANGNRLGKQISEAIKAELVNQRRVGGILT